RSSRPTPCRSCDRRSMRCSSRASCASHRTTSTSFSNAGVPPRPPGMPSSPELTPKGSRMKRIALVVALVTLAVVAAGATAVFADDLTVALSSLSTESLDPVLGGHVVKFYLDQIFEYLVGVTPDGQLSADGGLSTRWEASSDHKRWTFHLRRGVKFHNGDDLTSDDVKFSLQRAMGKRSTTGYAEPLRVLIKDIETPAPDREVI